MTILTDSKIRGLRPKASAYYVWHDTGSRGTGRIGIRVYPSGRKVFMYKYHKDGVRKFITLGDYPKMSLSEALASPTNEIIHNKQYLPIDGKYATFRELFERYLESRRSAGSRSLTSEVKRIDQVYKAKRINPDTPAREITTHQIRLCLSDFISRGALDSANRTRSLLKAVFQFGIYADNNPATMSANVIYGIKSNPVDPTPAQEIPAVALDRYLDWVEMKRFLMELSRVPTDSIFPPDVARALLLCLHTGGQRPYEIVATETANYDKEAATLTVSPEISKTKNFHVIPLTETAAAIIDEQIAHHPGSKMLFPGSRKTPFLDTQVIRSWLVTYCEYIKCEAFTPRDIRRTFKTLAASIGLSLELRDRIQNHKIPGVSSKHYDRYYYLKEKRRGLERWEKKLSQL